MGSVLYQIRLRLLGVMMRKQYSPSEMIGGTLISDGRDVVV
jgi:hypothetical protein